ncbi:MAG: hypothetical protein JNM65_09285 [Verrucomicrobiaceae bacterium]|nr:hypothetical protein [Verrucomicrobiaceae bacterium]
MRSQKQNNRQPRPFKNRQDHDRWSGGQGGGGYIPSSRPATPAKKTAPGTQAEKKLRG